jgi:hypothetical protein
VCTPDLIIIKYFGNNTIEIRRIGFTYPDLLPSALVELELIHVYLTVGIHLLWKSCDVRLVCIQIFHCSANKRIFLKNLFWLYYVELKKGQADFAVRHYVDTHDMKTSSKKRIKYIKLLMYNILNTVHCLS